MASSRLPVAGFPHLALSAQDDDFRQKTLTRLRAEGFKVDHGLLVPPEGATSPAVIMAITHAFHEAQRK
ncbi:hypothetical protein [Hyphomicrobium sp.]|uniref:hypothetical protein n=1 Tax=Hyphomicrobium sp. TaxID=82 RepID=UPI002E3592E4|nr:hypothetical protein [Hyphomicrobium sp.]HEX2842108.1 hypothetical protein [Hyphomicrobium sp.]